MFEEIVWIRWIWKYWPIERERVERERAREKERALRESRERKCEKEDRVWHNGRLPKFLFLFKCYQLLDKIQMNAGDWIKDLLCNSI